MIFPYNINRTSHMQTLDTKAGIVKFARVIYTTTNWNIQTQTLKGGHCRSWCGMMNK
jgi:hypothetical protein